MMAPTSVCAEACYQKRRLSRTTLLEDWRPLRKCHIFAKHITHTPFYCLARAFYRRGGQTSPPTFNYGHKVSSWVNTREKFRNNCALPHSTISFVHFFLLYYIITHISRWIGADYTQTCIIHTCVCGASASFRFIDTRMQLHK